MSHDADRAVRVSSLRWYAERNPSRTPVDTLDLLAELAHVTAERDALAVQVARLQEARDLDAAVSALAAARVLDQELADRPVTIGDAKACRDIARAGHHLNPATVDALLTSFLVGVGAEERAADLRAGKALAQETPAMENA